MYKLIWVLVLGLVECSPFFDSDANLVKPRFERNKVNKGVWLRNNRQDPFVKSSLGSFIFRANSLDVESQVQNGFDVFSSKQDGVISGFMGRYKREPHSTTNRRHRKSLNNKTKQNSSTASLLNDYHYEVTAFRDSPNSNNIDYNVQTKPTTKVTFEEQKQNETEATTGSNNDRKEATKQTDEKTTFEYLRDLTNASGENVSIPKRSKNYIIENDRINLLEDRNTNSNIIQNNNRNEKKTWQIAPVTDVVYEIIPKEPKEPKEELKHRPVSEKGLIKVLSMLTKTFKKITKQHSDITIIHDQMNNMNEGCKMSIEKHSKRLEDFDAKYTFFLKIMEKLKTLQDRLKAKEDGYKQKEEEMSKFLMKLESQQKTFLLQQQQFFNIQKLMLAQNEKINQKQNAIAKTQSEITLRQNNYARVLEKTKKVYTESKQPTLAATIANRKYDFNPNTVANKTNKIPIPASTESVKINLFSIPQVNPIRNQDQLILRDIDEKPVDDLIYKYYFNNTFIDTIIKNKILPGFFIADKTNIARNAKQKRNKHKATKTTINNDTEIATTILLPVYNETNLDTTLHRQRRWINHHSKRKHRRKHHGKGKSVVNQPLYLNEGNTVTEIKTTVKPEAVKVDSAIQFSDPFLNMATNFCNEIGQNSTKQILDWCVEKALRRLKSLDTKLIPQLPEFPVQVTSQVPIRETSYFPFEAPSRAATKNFKLIITEAPVKSTYATRLTTTTRDIRPPATLSEFSAFFPDNDELETNLRQFDLTPDPVGNVYYDGSLHESDVATDKSDALSDFMPGFDSNSRVDIDTRMMELQSLRQFHNQRVKNNQLRIQKKKH